MIKIERGPLKVPDYQALRASAGWSPLSDTAVEQGLKKDLFSVCAKDGNETVGVGRVIGDGAIYFYIQDLIVLPQYQNRGVGKLLLSAIEEYLSQEAPINAFIGLMAAKGVAEFYEKFGYKRRPETGPGMYKIAK